MFTGLLGKTFNIQDMTDIQIKYKKKYIERRIINDEECRFDLEC
nr:MAG TPA: hypothetical protein [Caudoviricetes sp.]